MIIRLHRISHFLWRLRIPVLPRLMKLLIRVVFGCVLPPSARVGHGVLLSYQGLGTVIHKDAELQDGVIVMTGVTIGGRAGRKGAPVIEAGALIGTGAKVLGPIRIGTRASIGANAVVISDIPPFAVDVGIPARVIRINQPHDIPDYRVFD